MSLPRRVLVFLVLVAMLVVAANGKALLRVLLERRATPDEVRRHLSLNWDGSPPISWPLPDTCRVEGFCSRWSDEFEPRGRWTAFYGRTRVPNYVFIDRDVEAVRWHPDGRIAAVWHSDGERKREPWGPGVEESESALSSGDLRWSQIEGWTSSGLELTQLDLSNALMKSCELIGASIGDLRGVELWLFDCLIVGWTAKDAVLSASEWHDVVVRDSDLSGIDLEKTSLIETRFEGANLVGARLQGSYLSGVVFDDCRLDGVRLDGATLNDVDFSGVRGLVVEQFAGAKLTGGRFPSDLAAKLVESGQLEGGFQVEPSGSGPEHPRDDD